MHNVHASSLLRCIPRRLGTTLIALLHLPLHINRIPRCRTLTLIVVLRFASLIKIIIRFTMVLVVLLLILKS